MILKDTLFLSAYTSRSYAYAQAMFRKNIIPAHIFLFGSSQGELPGQSMHFSEKLLILLQQFRCPVTAITAENVNDIFVHTAIERVKPHLVIYSGYGAQLVGKKLLRMSIPFLHIHAGWLPDYRGSTTTYYSILREKKCGVSAILLDTEIDTGSIVERRWYPVPPSGTDIDHAYDSAIRADLLVDVLSEWSRNGAFKSLVRQDMEEGTVYYVIHPVLKHLALLSLTTSS